MVGTSKQGITTGLTSAMFQDWEEHSIVTRQGIRQQWFKNGSFSAVWEDKIGLENVISCGAAQQVKKADNTSALFLGWELLSKVLRQG